MLAPSAARGGISATSLRNLAPFHSTASAMRASRMAEGSARSVSFSTSGRLGARPLVDLSEVHVMQRDVGYPSGVAVGVLLRHQPADVEAVRELHAQLERAQAEVDAQHVVGGAVGPGVGKRRVELAHAGMVLRCPVGVDHAAEIEAHHAGDVAEEGEADEHVEGEVQLRLPDVVAVAQEPRVAPLEAAQVVEAGEEELPPEAAALRQAHRGARADLAASDDLDGVDGVGLDVGVEAVAAAGGNGTRAELREDGAAPVGAAQAVARGVPAVGEVDLALRI